MKQEEKAIPVKSYSKHELADHYKVSPAMFATWLLKWEKELKKLRYDRNQKVLTTAQVRFIFQDDVLGQP